MTMNVGPCRVVLVDDGTLDTVLSVCYRIHPRIQEDIRFSQDHPANIRRADGCLTVEGFRELAKEAVDAFQTASV